MIPPGVSELRDMSGADLGCGVSAVRITKKKNDEGKRRLRESESGKKIALSDTYKEVNKREQRGSNWGKRGKSKKERCE